MIDIINLIIFSSAALIIAALVFFIIKLALINRNLKVVALQSELDRIKIMVQLEKVQGSNEIEKTDGFLKFVSDSRDWAFQYIEDIQHALLAYDIALNTNDAATINVAYKNLIAMLPNDDVVS